MKKSPIKLFNPYIDKNEENEIVDILKSKFWASGSGTGKVKQFETKFNDYNESKERVAVNSETAALQLALHISDIKDKEVILPSFSFVSTAHVIIYNGCKPVS
jgi:dTDP-4-amino-4,6-dideoxygalactose transaminase